MSVRTVTRSDAGLILANVIGPAAWTAHLLIEYALVSVACESPWRVAEASYHLVTLACGCLAALGIVAGGVALGVQPDAAHARRRQWMATTAVLFSTLFLLAIVFGGIPAAILPECP